MEISKDLLSSFASVYDNFLKSYMATTSCSYIHILVLEEFGRKKYVCIILSCIGLE